MPPKQPSPINAAWTKYRSAAYLSGRGISFGCPEPIYPQQAVDGGKYSINVDILRTPSVDICDIDYSILAPHSLDHAFIAPRFVEVPDQSKFLDTITSKLKTSSHIVIHVIQPPEYIETLRGLLKEVGLWKEKDVYFRAGQILGIWKLLGHKQRGLEVASPKPSKRACIARYGAVGDMIMISPLIRKLHEDGYHVTCNITPYCAEVLKHNPYVDNIVLQERDVIPNGELGQYWAEWAQEYDKYINLSESIEGKLLKVEGRRDFYTTKAWRNEQFGHINYYDQTMRLGGYPDVLGTKGELYFSRSEEKDATYVKGRFKDKFLILWALKGSSYHKQYPLLEPILRQWLSTHGDAHVLLTGSPSDKHMEFQHPQVTGMCGNATLREVFALTKVVDLVAGPETAVTNAAGCFSTPKLLLLSHSTAENLSKYWENCTVLEPENVPCYPCNQLHYNLESCPQIEILGSDKLPIWKGPTCAGIGVSGTRMLDALDSIYAEWKASKLK